MIVIIIIIKVFFRGFCLSNVGDYMYAIFKLFGDGNGYLNGEGNGVGEMIIV